MFLNDYNKTFSGNSFLEDSELTSVMKISKLCLNENMRNEICKIIKEKLQIQNVAPFYQVAKIFNLTTVHRETFSCIKFCFTMLVDTPNFLELDFTNLSKILRSSELSLTSEREVYHAAENWLKHNFEERRKFAVQLLLTVRLPLLSEHTLKYLTDNSSSFSEIDECKAILTDASSDKDNHNKNNASVCHTSRYCNQDMYSILVCGGVDATDTAVSNVKQLNATNLDCVSVLSPMVENRRDSVAVCLKGEVYLFGGRAADHGLIRTVDKYSPATNEWVKVADMPGEVYRYRVYFDVRQYFCACAFMDKIFIIGGYNRHLDKHFAMVYNHCVQFDPTVHGHDFQWVYNGGMNEARMGAACAAFEEKVVVTGGVGYDYDDDDDDAFIKLNTAECYDVAADVWTQMPNMRAEREDHSLVAVKSKLFAIGGRYSPTSEVYDSSSDAFVLLKFEFAIGRNKALSVGSKIFIFDIHEDLDVAIYDVHNDEWSEKYCEATESFRKYSCVKVPNYLQNL